MCGNEHIKCHYQCEIKPLLINKSDAKSRDEDFVKVGKDYGQIICVSCGLGTSYNVRSVCKEKWNTRVDIDKQLISWM